LKQDENLTANDKQFDALCQQYYRSWFRYHPDEAVDVGVFDYANQLKSFEHDDIGGLIVLNKKMKSALEELNPLELNQQRQVDYRIIKGAVTIESHDLEENDWRFRNPSEYLPVNAIYQLLIHEVPKAQAAIRERLQLIPDYLRKAKVILASHPERVVPEWAATATDIAYSGSDFIRGLARNPLISSKFTNPGSLQPLLDAAAAALNDFAKYIESDLMPVAEGKFASGSYRFDRLLSEKHFLDCDAQQLREFGERLMSDTEHSLKEKSKQICEQEDIAAALTKIRKKHPQAKDLLGSYRKQMQAAHSWLLKTDIITVPETQSLKVQQTPDFLRALIPFAAYEPPMPLDREQRGIYYVTTVEDEALLAEHNHCSIDLTSAHEAFPGHHLQFVIANRFTGNNVTRLLNASASLYEGWALYCEQLVFEKGLFNKDEHEFIMLRDRLWRALRIVIDVGLHTGQLSFDEAADLLVEKLGFDLSQAKSEINWYSSAAATPLCYAVGREIIVQLREKVVSDTGDNQQLKLFHDALLSQGSIALPLVVKTLFGDSVWKAVHDEIFSS